MRKKLFALLLVVTLVALCGCGKVYSESDIENARQRGYDDGYSDGYFWGSYDQKEKDCDNFLIDGYSVRDIEEQVYKEYGVTPSEAFMIVDEYEYDWTHGGYTRSEYQNAVEAIFYTAAIFPFDY